MSSSIPKNFQQFDEDYIQQMVEFIPVVGILGWTVFLQALGNMESDNGIKCSRFRIIIQWVYLFFAFLISIWYYIRQSHTINNGQNKTHIDKKVIKWKYIICHLIVTIIYLFTVNIQPIACHLTNTTQLSHLYIIQMTIVLLTTAVLKLCHAISFQNLSPDEIQNRKQGLKQLQTNYKPLP
eukprot:296759_1